ncbi:Panacea domain-containing protein [Spiroplasma endosymbiont of Glossina fuscipes fuscipes]
MLSEFKQIQESYNINEEEIVRLSNLEIQKLLYFINGNYYAKFGKKLISDKFEAWKYGPVIPHIYHWLRENKNNKIYIDINDNEIIKIINKFSKHFNEEEIKFIKKIFNFYSKFSVYQLVNLSHEGPWQLTNENEEIKDELIKEYFSKELCRIQNFI